MALGGIRSLYLIYPHLLMARSTTAMAEDAQKPRVYTVPEVARLMKVTPRTVYSWVSEGHLSAVNLGTRLTRVREEALREFLDRNPLAAERAT